MPPIHFFWKLGNVLKILNCLGFYSFSLTPTYAYFNSSIDFCKSESIIILSVKNFFWESAKNFQGTMFVSSTNVVHSSSSFRLKINVQVSLRIISRTHIMSCYSDCLHFPHAFFHATTLSLLPCTLKIFLPTQILKRWHGNPLLG